MASTSTPVRWSRGKHLKSSRRLRFSLHAVDMSCSLIPSIRIKLLYAQTTLHVCRIWEFFWKINKKIWQLRFKGIKNTPKSNLEIFFFARYISVFWSIFGDLADCPLPFLITLLLESHHHEKIKDMTSN